MDTLTCDTPMSGRTLVQQDDSFSPITLTETTDREYDLYCRQKRLCGPYKVNTPAQNFDEDRQHEIIKHIHQLLINQGHVLDDLVHNQERPSVSNSVSHSPGVQGSRNVLAKGAAKFKTWAKGGKHGITFRVEESVDSGQSEIKLHYKELDGQDIQELAAPSLPCELPSEPASYRETEDYSWRSIRIPGVTAATPETSPVDQSQARTSDIPASGTNSYNGVTRLDSTASLLHKISKKRQRPLRAQLDDVNKYGWPLTGEVFRKDSMSPDTTPSTHTQQSGRSEQSLAECLLENFFILEERHPLVFKSDQGLRKSRHDEYDRSSLPTNNEETRKSLMRRLGLICPIVGNSSDTLRWLETGSTCSSLVDRRTASAPVSPFNTDDSRGIYFSRDTISRKKDSETVATYQPPTGATTCIRRSRSLPSVRLVSPRMTLCIPQSDTRRLTEEVLDLVDHTSETCEVSNISKERVSILRHSVRDGPVRRPEDDKHQCVSIPRSNVAYNPGPSQDHRDGDNPQIWQESTIEDVRIQVVQPTSESPLSIGAEKGRIQATSQLRLRGKRRHDPLSEVSSAISSKSAPGSQEEPSLTLSEDSVSQNGEVRPYTEKAAADSVEGTAQTRVSSNPLYRDDRQDDSLPGQSPTSSPWIDRQAPAGTFGPLLISSVLQLIQQGTAFLQRISGTEPLPQDHVRIYWRCGCGAQLHDDFKELRFGAALELEAQLNGYRSCNNSDASSPSSPSSNGNSLFSTPANSAPSSATTRSAANSANNSPTDPKSMPMYPGDASITIHESSSTYLLTCANEGRFTPRWTNLDTSPDKISDDKDLSMALRAHYLSLNGKWYHYLRLRGLTRIEFVQFRAHRNKFADIRKRPDMPGIDNYDYEFKPDLVPPVGSNYLIHLLNHPQDSEQERIAYERFPKRRSKLIAGECGWGIELVETFLADRVWALLVLLFGVGSGVFAIVWAVTEHDVQGAFGIASWVCGLATLLVGWLEACLG